MSPLTANVIEISQLVVRERQNRVRRRPADLAACFHPDATITTSWLQGTVAEFVSGQPANSRNGPIVNRAGPPIVNESGPRAVVELPSTTIHWIQVGGVEAELTSFMRLLYRIETRDGAWKIADLTAINEGDTLRPSVVGTSLRIDQAQLDQYRHSYRFLAYTRALDGVEVSDDLYGVDRPGPVDELYAHALAWLAAADEAMGA
jgi:hypothetical protein